MCRVYSQAAHFTFHIENKKKMKQMDENENKKNNNIYLSFMCTYKSSLA